MKEDYLQINKTLWNVRTETHLDSNFYDVDGFLKGKSSLNQIELELLGDVNNKSLLHLQCHFGQDSLSLAMMGAQVTGVDFSERAIAKANELSAQLNLNCEFICCDLYDLPENCTKKFDLIFTSYGTIVWLPDLAKWAKIISTSLKPGGQFIFVDFHPMLLMMDNSMDHISYDYFNKGAIVEMMEESYTDGKKHEALPEITWNHNLAEVIGCLLAEKLRLIHFQEYDYSPYPCFKKLVPAGPGKYQFEDKMSKLPVVYSLVFEK